MEWIITALSITALATSVFAILAAQQCLKAKRQWQLLQTQQIQLNDQQLHNLHTQISKEIRTSLSNDMEQMSTKMEFLKSDFLMLAQEHVEYLGRQKVQGLNEQDYEEADIVLKTKVGNFS